MLCSINQLKQIIMSITPKEILLFKEIISNLSYYDKTIDKYNDNQIRRVLTFISFIQKNNITHLFTYDMVFVLAAFNGCFSASKGRDNTINLMTPLFTTMDFNKNTITTFKYTDTRNPTFESTYELSMSGLLSIIINAQSYNTKLFFQRQKEKIKIIA